jgi:hypothetical protein
MKRARKLGRRYIRSISDCLREAFRNPRFRARVAAHVIRNNALLRKLVNY